jgi:hypothetical protein
MSPECTNSGWGHSRNQDLGQCRFLPTQPVTCWHWRVEKFIRKGSAPGARCAIRTGTVGLQPRRQKGRQLNSPLKRKCPVDGHTENHDRPSELPAGRLHLRLPISQCSGRVGRSVAGADCALGTLLSTVCLYLTYSVTADTAVPALTLPNRAGDTRSQSAMAFLAPVTSAAACRPSPESS